MPAAVLQFTPVPVDPAGELDLYADGVLGTVEAAKFLGVCKATLYALMDSGELPYSQDGPGCRRKVPKRGIQQYLARRKVRVK